MYEMSIFQNANAALVLTLWLSMPAIAVAAVVGLVVSLVQALTQIQDQTLQHTVKLIAVVVTLIATGPLFASELAGYTERMFDEIVARPR